MTKEKVEKLKKVLGENSSLVRSRQEHIVFTNFIIEKTRELQSILFRDYGIGGKRDALSLAVLFLLEELSEKDKDKKDGK